MAVKDWDEKRIRPADATINQIVDAARVTGNVTLLDRIGHDMARVDLVQGLGQRPLPEQGAAVGALKAAAAAGTLSPGQAPILRQLEERQQAITTGLSNNPISTTVANFPERFLAPKALNTQNPQQLSADIAYRGRIAQFAAENWKVPTPSALDDVEIRALQAELTNGNANNTAAIIGALTGLPPDVYWATMTKQSMRDALDGMVRSYDPVKLNVAMTTLDELYRRNPDGFVHSFKDDTFRRLQTWQARRDSMTPQQMAEYFQRADDPAAKAGRKHLEDEADEKMKKLGPADVATAFGNSWGITPGIISRNVTGSDPSPPADPLQAATLTAEFKGLVRERYVDTGDMDKAQKQAAERLKTIWGPSEVNSNGLMRYPPDRYYPAVDGSYAWMTRDLESSIEKQVGKPRYDVSTKGSSVLQRGQTGAPELSAANWSYRLLSDSETEADVKMGRAPTYKVMIVDAADGRIDIRPTRFQFDPATAQTQARDEFTGRRDDIGRRRTEAAANVRAMQSPMQRLGEGP